MPQRRFTSVSLHHVPITVLLLLVFLLLSRPAQTRQHLEAQPDFPAGVNVLAPEGFPEGRGQPDAQRDLRRLEDAKQLAFWTALSQRPGRQPELFISRSLVGQGLVQLHEGRLPDRPDEALVLSRGPYRPGATLISGERRVRVTGTVRLRWVSAAVSDATIIRLAHVTDLTPDALPTFTFRSAGTAPTPTEVAALAGRAAGLKYAAVELSTYLSDAGHYVDLARARLQEQMIFTLLLLLLGTLLGRLALAWHDRRDTLRIERMLGRSSRDFARQWNLHGLRQWGWGVLAACLSAALLALTRTVPIPPGRAAWTVLAVVICAALSTALLGLNLRDVPLARPGVRRGQTHLTLWLPALMTALLTVAVPVLGSQAARLWWEQRAVSRAVGEGTLVGVTLPNATRSPTSADCPPGLPCLPVGWSNMYLWPPSWSQLPGRTDLLARWNPADSGVLNLALVQGRWPRPGAREAVISQKAFEELRAVQAGVQVGAALQQGYRLVGVVGVPPHSGITLFGNFHFYDATLFVPWAAPGLSDDLFRAPMGGSALILPSLSAAQRQQFETRERARYGALEFYRPAEYATQVVAGTRQSLNTLLVLLLVGGVLAGLSYLTTLKLAFILRQGEILVWRMLGMPLGGVMRRVMTPLLLTIGGSGALGLLGLTVLARPDPVALLLGAATLLMLFAQLLWHLQLTLARQRGRSIRSLYQETE